MENERHIPQTEALQLLHIDYKEAHSIFENDNRDFPIRLSDEEFEFLKEKVEEKRALEKGLENIKNEESPFPLPPEKNAMCYCQSPDFSEQQERERRRKFGCLTALAIIIAAVIITIVLLVK